MEELRAFVDKSLNFSDDLTLGLRNQARCEVYAKFQLSGLKGTQEWEELWVEAEPRLKLETVQQSTLGKVYMCVRLGLMSWYWASLALPILLSMPLWSLNFHLKRRSRLWRWLGPMDFLQRILLSSMLTVVGVEVEASGEENTVGELSMILYNHGSNCDSPVIVASHVKSLCFWIGKKEILCLPILGVLFWFQGHLFINRRKREESIRAMNHFISGVIKKNKPVCIAPEGARSKNGHLQEFKKGPFHAHKAMRCPIIPTFLAGSFENWPAGQLFFSMSRVSLKFAPKVIVDNEKCSTDDVRIAMTKLFHEMRHTAYSATTCEPVSKTFFLRHLCSYPVIYALWQLQAYSFRLIKSLIF
eukprot:GEMP01007624.1.p1 GENE.GEMP01007624.1~~GEMP01007624.1.p1  ORF type:complete len:358 (-),score=40.25 GEMP01007624.1:1314-2387(-)